MKYLIVALVDLGQPIMRNSPLVYLAGPITGESWAGSTDWRDAMIYTLAQYELTGVSPLRGKDYLKNETAISDSYENTTMSSSKSIFARDFHDVQRCDALLVNFLGSKKVSIGTVMEITYAWTLRKPIVVVMDPDNIHKHSMLGEASSFVVSTLDEAAQVLHSLFH